MLLTRDKFRSLALERDGHKCVFFKSANNLLLCLKNDKKEKNI